MNLLMVCVLLLVALVCQPTLIYGLKGSHNSAATAAATGDHDFHQRQRNVKTFGGKVKRSHSNSLHSATAAELANAKLVMALESGDVFVRRATRGANAEGTDDSATNIDAATATVGGSGGGGAGVGGKRNKNGDANKNGGRKQDKKYSATIGSQTQQQQEQQQHHSHHSNGNGNGKGRQRQQQPGHGKRGGNGDGSKARAELAEKLLAADKAPSSCRYAKSAWTECDPKTNMRTRTLTLKKGEANCLATRTMQKKCKKTCRYEKGAWSECINGQMTRQDKLRSNTATGTTEATVDSSCELVRDINRKCNPGGAKMSNKGNKERKHKDKVQRRAKQA
ncbi:uncharacterized protein [Eurosta solidaginis]|uniref:uncharacterized protein n=1 Tax=Eurosta solidaginis TaxID=178769 RepID=UPI0035315059